MTDPASLLHYFVGLQDWALALLRRLVETESFSSDKEGVDRLVALLAAEFDAMNIDARRFREPEAGDVILASLTGREGSPGILVLAHTDTVWPTGTLASRPFRIEEGRAQGPGVFDMKAGLVLCLMACRAYKEGMLAPRRDVRFLFTSDEETGTSAGLPHIRREAAACTAALCLEPPLPGGGVKTSRKGVAVYRLGVRGIAAHAGVDPEKGASAILELARQIVRISDMAVPARGLTVSAGTVQGGTASNVIAAEASCEVDVRFRSCDDGGEIERLMRALQPFDARCTLSVLGGMNRPPLVRNAGVLDLYRMAAALAGELGMALGEGESGGGSDGSFTAALGIPTLDGIGVAGEGAHAYHESVAVSDIAPRAALLCGLLESI